MAAGQREKLLPGGGGSPPAVRASSVSFAELLTLKLQQGHSSGPRQADLIPAARHADVELGLAPLEQDAPLPLPSSSHGWLARLRRLAGAAGRRLGLGSGGEPSSSLEEELSPSSSAPFVPGSLHLLGDRRQRAQARWRLAVGAVLETRALQRAMDVLLDHIAPASDRLWAVVELERRLALRPNRAAVLQGLLRRQETRTQRLQSHMLNELYITGEHVLQFFTPPQSGQHRPYVTWALVTVLYLLFFFMAGQYAAYKAVSPGSGLACLVGQRQSGPQHWGPTTLVRWLSPRDDAWCLGGKPFFFDATFLIDYGARWAPSMHAQPTRWLTSSLLHTSFMHLLTNSLLLLALGIPMEAKYGSWRLAVVGVAAAVGGNLWSAVLEAPCVAVVGASGIVFGVAGLMQADMVLNFHTLRRPVLRAVVLLAFLSFFVGTVASTPQGTSHLSHVGGLLAGLCGGMVLLPALGGCRERWQWALTGAAVLLLLAMFIALPLVFYLAQLPGVSC